MVRLALGAVTNMVAKFHRRAEKILKKKKLN